MPRWLIVLAASAGGIPALRTVLGSLAVDLPAAIVVVQHRPPERNGYLDTILDQSGPLPAHVPTQGERIAAGTIYLARADSHITVTDDHAFLYRDGSRICFLRSSANPLLESAARVFGRRVIAVVLTGGGTDATDGVQAVHAAGGVVIAQDEATSEFWEMPKSAIESGVVDYVLPVAAIGPTLNDLAHGRPVSHVTGA